MVAMSDARSGAIAGRTVVMTGISDGIGRLAALALARAGARIAGTGRDPAKCRAAEAALRAPDPGAHVLAADLSSASGCAKAAAKLAELAPKIDVLALNAGAIFWTREESADGIEMTFALNHLGYYRMASHLMGQVLAAGPHARIVMTSSVAHRRETLDFDDLEMRSGYEAWTAYGRSKLANIYMTRTLARRLQGRVSVNCFHPGFVATNIGANTGAVRRAVVGLVKRLMAGRPEDGAATLVHLASAPEAAGQTGLYFVDRKPASISKAAEDDEAAERLMAISAEMTGRTLDV